MYKLSMILVFMVFFATNDVLAQNGGAGNGAKVSSDGYLVNVVAYERCPTGDFVDSNRHHIAVQADFTGNGTDKTAKTNKIFLMKGDTFWVQDGNACDDGANFYMPLSADNCSGDCSLEAPTFTEYEVRARLVGKPNSGVTATSCLDAWIEDTNGDGVVDENDELTGLCSVGDGNILVQTRIVGSGKEQNKWENVSQELLTVCIDTDLTDGVTACDKRVGLFDQFGENYWWNWDTKGRAHMQLVFYPVNSGVAK
jgi:hypothetical protein